MPGDVVKTDAIVRRYDAEDTLVSETTTTVVESPKPAGDKPAPGMYL